MPRPTSPAPKARQRRLCLATAPAYPLYPTVRPCSGLGTAGDPAAVAAAGAAGQHLAGADTCPGRRNCPPCAPPSCSCCPELPARPPPPDIPRLSCPAQPALLPGDAGGASPGLCPSIPASAPPAAGPWWAAAAPTAERLIRGLGGKVQLWAAHLQPTRRRAPGKEAGLPGFDAGRQIGGAAPYGPPQAPDPPVLPSP